MGRGLKREERILLYGSNLWYLGEGMLGPLFAVFATRIGGNILDISWAWATYLAVTGILIVLIGRLVDRSDKEKILVAGYAINAFFTFGYLFVTNSFELILVQAGLGVGTALATPSWDALFDKHTDSKRDGYMWGLAHGHAYIITAVALILGGLIVNYFSFAILFAVMGSVQILATLYQAQILCKGR